MNQNVFIRRACMSLMFSMLCLLSLAQTHQVSGIVKDVTGEAGDWSQCICARNR